MKKMKAHIISMGSLIMPKSMLYGNEYDNTLLKNIPIYGVLIVHIDGLVLFDTGCNFLDGYDKFKSYYQYNEEDLLINRLAEIGYSIDDIKYVVLSHLHFDHSGNVHLFKNAQIFVSRNEYIKTMLDYRNGKETAVDPKEVELWINNDLNWYLIEEDKKEILSDLIIYNFGSGHSYGMLAILLNTQTIEKLMIVGDIAYTREALKSKVPGAVVDIHGYLNSIAKINELQKKEGFEIWFGHDIEQFAKLKKSTIDFY